MLEKMQTDPASKLRSRLSESGGQGIRSKL